MYNPEASVRFKDLPNFSALFGNLSNSWSNALPNDLFIKGVPKVVFKDQATTKLINGGNVGAGLDTIHTFTLPGGSLRANGDILDIWYAGDPAANDNNKRLVASFGGVAYEDSGNRDFDGSIGWNIAARVSRVSATSVIVNHHTGLNIISTDGVEALVAFGTSSYFAAGSSAITGLADLGSNNMTLLVQAEAVADDDMVIRQVILTLTRF